MTQFEPAMMFCMGNEDSTLLGKTTPDPTSADKNAIARFGINSAAVPEALTENFYGMSREDALEWAANWYRKNVWEPVSAKFINDQAIASKFFDACVNMGQVQATKLLQFAVNDVKGGLDLGVKVDGHIGPDTLRGINSCDAELLMARYKTRLMSFYSGLVTSDPTKQKYLSGWLARAAKTPSETAASVDMDAQIGG